MKTNSKLARVQSFKIGIQNYWRGTYAASPVERHLVLMTKQNSSNDSQNLPHKNLTKITQHTITAHGDSQNTNKIR